MLAESYLRHTLRGGLRHWRRRRRRESRFRWSTRFWRRERSRSYTFWDYAGMERRRGCWRSVFFAGSAFFVMNSATFFTHPASTLFGLLFALAASEYLENPRVVPAIGAGVAFSAVAATRHYDAVLLVLPAVVALVRRSSPAHWRLVPLVAISGLPVIGALLAYYWATGNPLLTPTTSLGPAGEILAKFDVVRSTEILFGRGIELAEWTSAPFLAVYLWALGRRAYRNEL